MDADRLLAEVAKRHGTLLDRRDPVMIMATMAEIVMEDAQASIRQMLTEAQEQVTAATNRQTEQAQKKAEVIITKSGTWVEDRVRFAMGVASTELLASVRAARDEMMQAAKFKMWGAAVGAGAGLLALGLILGYLISCTLN
jgi:hypothetical protein